MKRNVVLLVVMLVILAGVFLWARSQSVQRGDAARGMIDTQQSIIATEVWLTQEAR